MFSVCATNSGQILVACRSVLFYLEVQQGKIVPSGDTVLEYEVILVGFSMPTLSLRISWKKYEFNIPHKLCS